MLRGIVSSPTACLYRGPTSRLRVSEYFRGLTRKPNVFKRPVVYNREVRKGLRSGVTVEVDRFDDSLLHLKVPNYSVSGTGTS